MIFHFLHLSGYSIFAQLVLEEALLRADTRNWCLVNEGSSRAIVMGISGDPRTLIACERAAADRIPVIKRFSGGGTVIVDEDTLFVTWICQKELHPFPCYPEPILRWTEELYRSVLRLPSFRLKENDYALGDRKCGGNAQYLRKERWLHHTSFLWDYQPHNMTYLLHPPKAPVYRRGRGHDAFLCRLRDHYPSRERLLHSLKEELRARYTLVESSLAEAQEVIRQPHRTTTCALTCAQLSG
jgi:lipoate-protein ligase A